MMNSQNYGQVTYSTMEDRERVWLTLWFYMT